ncbi:MAG: bifunctional serine/threonine-protein kinase/formylglycine-generating enzyme family protein [Candidatus Promineifilaceae bacterium]
MTEQIDRYEIKQLIGRGGMASVFAAYDPYFEREVAIKVLPSQYLDDWQFRARFEREARTIAGLEHPAIVPVYDFGEFEGRLFLVMRLMSGGSLADKIKAGPLSLAETVRILGRLAPALDAAHAQGLIHRDLKPGNILFDHWGEPYISDFGIVKVLDDEEVMLTMPGGMVGTPAYMSPEQVEARVTLDGRSDIYAMGCILFEMLTGRLPFKADTPLGIAFMHVTEPVPRLQTFNNRLPIACEQVLAKAMAKDREERYQTAVELSDALRTAMTTVQAAPPKPQQTAPDHTVIERMPSEVQRPQPRSQPIQAAESIAPEISAEKPSEQSGLPRWVWAAAAVLLLVLCIGGGAAIFTIINNGLLQGNGDNGTPLVALTGTATSERATPSATSAAVIVEDTSTPTITPSQTPTPTPTLTPTPEGPPAQAALGDLWGRPVDGMIMAYVPAGSFVMGSDPELDPAAGTAEQPPHEVSLSAFWIDQTEVTNAMFARFVAAMGYVTTAEEEGTGQIQEDVQSEVVAGTDWQHPSGPDSDLAGLDNYPVLQVSWIDAQAYCSWAGGSLPTEAQWEYAARGPENWLYPWGNTFDGNLVNFCDANCTLPQSNASFDDHSARLAPVGSLPDGASWVGAFDLAGNVWEWVADWFSPDYYSNSPVENPTGPETGDGRVLRGGSWYDDAPHVRAGGRGASGPTNRHALYGFRCVLPGG